MNVFNYYIERQKQGVWYNKFQSTSGKQSGKTFSYTNTNFRHLLSFLVQFERFSSKFGKNRKDWNDRLPGGQELDKHRIINLLQAGLIKNEDSYYYITPKGIAVFDLIKSDFSETEKWIITYLLLLDYSSNDRKLDILKTVQELFSNLARHNISHEWITDNLLDNIYMKEKEKLFLQDIFWLISFSNDSDFTKNYVNSSEEEKDLLKRYVLTCAKSRKSTDLIAHKFVPSGVYSGAMFNDDIKVLYFSTVVLRNIKKSFEDFIEATLSSYCDIFYLSRKKEILNFISKYKSIFIRIKQNILEGVN